MRRKSLLGKRAFGFRIFSPFMDFNLGATIDKPATQSDVKSQKEVLFDDIFSVDPITKLPSGDITVYMSNETSPQVKDFIKNNLLLDYSSSSENVPHDGLTDDDVIKYSRNSGESDFEYRDRMFSLLKDERMKLLDDAAR